MSELTKEQCEEIRGRVEKAPPPPWEAVGQDLVRDGRYMDYVGSDDDGEPIGEVCGGPERLAEGEHSVIDFAAHARTDIPALLDTVASLRAKIAEAQEERVEAAKRLANQAARWLDDFIADSELIDAINGELDAALENLENNDGK